MAEALVVIDMQRMFVEAVGEHGPRVVQAVNRSVSETLRAGGSVFYTRDIQPAARPPFAGADALADGLDVRGPVLDKGPGMHGGFSGFVLAPRGAHPGAGGLSRLAGALADAGATHVTVVGLAADVCVSATAADAARLGYPTTVPLDATAFVHAHPDGDDAAMADLASTGVRVVADAAAGDPGP
jgi:nicotinamidase/pyrazinamidase